MSLHRIPSMVFALLLSSLVPLSGRDPAANQAMSNGQTAFEKGNFTEARKAFEQACGVADPPGESDEWRAVCLHSYGAIAAQLGEFRQAEGLYLKAKELWEKAPASHPIALCVTLSNLGEIYEQQTRWNDAQRILQQAVAIETRTLGPGHVRTAGTTRRLASAYVGLGELDRAVPLLANAIRIQKTGLPAEAQELALSLNALALLEIARSRYLEAEAALREAMEVTRGTRGEDHPDFAASLANLAGVYLIRRDYVRAAPPLARAIHIYETTLGPAHVRLSTLLIHSAVIHTAARKFALAEAESKRAIAIMQQAFGAKSLHVAWANANLAETYLQQNKTNQAEPILTEALATQRKYFERPDSRLAATLRDMAELRVQQRRIPEAAAFYREAIQLFEQTLGQNHLEVAVTLQDYARALKHAKHRSAGARPQAGSRAGFSFIQ